MGLAAVSRGQYPTASDGGGSHTATARRDNLLTVVEVNLLNRGRIVRLFHVASPFRHRVTQCLPDAFASLFVVSCGTTRTNTQEPA